MEIVVFVDLAPVYTSLQAFFEDEVKPDVSIAKNYLNALELEDMGRLVNAVLDMAESMAKRHIPMTMEDWANRIDIILGAGGDTVLDNAGQIV